MTQIIAVDFGGTNIRAAYFPHPEPPATTQKKLSTNADEGAQAVIDRIILAIQEQIPQDTADLRIGLGAPGPLDPVRGIVLDAPNLPGWKDIPLRDILQDRFGCPVFIGNDANVAALGEWRFGAGRGSRHLVYLTISTGIGGGVIVDSNLLVGSSGLAGELGHITILPDGPVCGCGNRGHIEAIASGPGIARRAAEGLGVHPESVLNSILAENGTLSGKDIGSAALDGDEYSVQIMREAGLSIGHLLADLCHIFNPEVFVLGGGVSMVGDIFFDAIRDSLRQHVMNPSFLDGLRVVPAALGDDAGLIGAMVLASLE
jgi:glucokinase